MDGSISHERAREYERSKRDDLRRSRSPHIHRRRRDHDHDHDRSRSRSPRRRSRSPRRRRSASRSTSPSGRKEREDRHERRRGRSPLRSRSRDSHKDRGRRQDGSRDKRRRSRSASSSSSDSSEPRRYKRKKDKHKKRRSRSRSRDKDRKEKKKSKKDKKKHKTGAVSHQWGKYGIINETDLYNKEQEFRSWLVEERKINPETVSKEQTKKEFARFVEDYNTATLPHEKYYRMEEYERRMSALRAGEYVPPANDGYDPTADMRAHESSHKRQSVKHDTYKSREELLELQKVQRERIQVAKMKLLGMEIKQNLGVRMDGSMFDG